MVTNSADVVEVVGLTKTYGRTRAVDRLSFTLSPGVVTGFLGPNGSGKSTTMRLMLGLDRGQGVTNWFGQPLTGFSKVSTVVGSHLDAKCFVPSRTARAHLRMMAAESGVSKERVDEVIELVGLTQVAKNRPKSYSLGMAQRLGLAGALLAQPKVLLLDEPANGLDPQSIQWLRDFLRHYAAQGNIVFVSSHLLSEMQLIAEHVVVISRGQLIANEDVGTFVRRSTRNDVFVRSPQRDRLLAALAEEGVVAEADGKDGIAVKSADTDRVGDVAFRYSIPLAELTARSASLEQAFLELTTGEQQFATGSPAAAAGPGGAE